MADKTYSVFTTAGSRAGRTYSDIADAKKDCDDRNAKATAADVDAQYEVREYKLNAKVDGRESVRDSYVPIK